MDKGRVTWADLSKGILILFVIVGHVFQNKALHNFLSSFYMPCFFIVSGFFMRNISQKDFFKKLFFGILIYYFVFAVLWIVFQFAQSLLLESDFNVYSYTISILLPYSGRTGGNVYIFWFLPCLLLAKTITYYLLYKNLICKIVSICVTAVFFVLGLIFNNYCSILMCSSLAVFFLLLGNMLKKLEFFTINSVTKRLLIILISSIVFTVCYVFNCLVLNNDIDFSSLYYGNIVLYILGAVSGSISMLTICSFIKKLLFISFIGRYSLLYYGLHYFFVSVFSFLLTKCNIANIFIREALVFFLVLLFTSVTVVLFITIKKFVEAKHERAIN